jgi:hypothetical protein
MGRMVKVGNMEEEQVGEEGMRDEMGKVGGMGGVRLG